MGLLGRRGRAPARKRAYRIYYATDLHGSDSCFRKFLAAGRVFDADAIVMGGDMTGKAIVPVRDLGRGRYEAEFQGSPEHVREGEELERLKKRIVFNGFYPWVASPTEIRKAEQDPDVVARLFEEFMQDQARRWANLAAERVEDRRRCFISPGNDDLPVIDQILATAERVEFPDKKAIEVGPLTMISVGDSNVTPWRTPREMAEDELLTEMKQLIEPYADGRPLLLNFHVPPHDSGLDVVNALDPSYRPVVEHGMIAQTSAGSTAVREVIEQYQPVASLHGHIHEGRGMYRLGRSICLNPGSDYSSGILQGLVIDFDENGQYLHHAFTDG